MFLNSFSIYFLSFETIFLRDSKLFCRNIREARLTTGSPHGVKRILSQTFIPFYIFSSFQNNAIERKKVKNIDNDVLTDGTQTGAL